jgi:hypothetical protein
MILLKCLRKKKRNVGSESFAGLSKLHLGIGNIKVSIN